MMSDSGWPDMPNKHIVMLSIFLATAAAAIGQEGFARDRIGITRRDPSRRLNK
jgi:hypothetical protein